MKLLKLKLKKTINCISCYNITDEQYAWLIELWLVNWCWANGGFNFDDTLENIKTFPWFDELKLESFKKDLKKICFEHDLDYLCQKGFYGANYKMARKVKKLLSWTKQYQQWIIFFSLFFALNLYGKEAYYKCKK